MGLDLDSEKGLECMEKGFLVILLLPISFALRFLSGFVQGGIQNVRYHNRIYLHYVKSLVIVLGDGSSPSINRPVNRLRWSVYFAEH